ncbi:hypothetical protein TWF694_001446 [Orbilia ellipsospora]|uniref:Uncharacterized protein n=1 Tax=Orbilia ellipsospora TaxID=2528407 RepID=A0AAV9XRT7_9PEZI
MASIPLLGNSVVERSLKMLKACLDENEDIIEQNLKFDLCDFEQISEQDKAQASRILAKDPAKAHIDVAISLLRNFIWQMLGYSHRIYDPKIGREHKYALIGAWNSKFIVVRCPHCQQDHRHEITAAQESGATDKPLLYRPTCRWKEQYCVVYLYTVHSKTLHPSNIDTTYIRCEKHESLEL